jgi:hypothetical protein
MPIITGQFNNVWTRKIDETFFEAWDEEPEEWPNFLQDKTSSQHNETYQSYAGSQNWQVKNEMQNANEQTFQLADLIVTEHTPYGVEAVLSREFIADSKYDEVIEMTSDFGHGGRNTVEQNSVSILDGAFTTNQYDGVPLCSDSHPYRKTGLAGTQDNLTTGGITDTNVKAGINLFNTLNDEGGKRIKMRASKFISHENNQFEFATVFESALRAGTANNDKNSLPSLQFVGSTFIASQTAWFLQSKQHKLIHFYRIKPEFVKRKYMEGNGSQVWDGYFRESTVVRNWRGMVGSQG